MKFLKKIISVVCLNVSLAAMSIVCADGLIYARAGCAEGAEAAQYRSGVSEESKAGELRMTVRDEYGTKRLLCPDQPTDLHESICFSFPDDVLGWEVRVGDGLWEDAGGSGYTVSAGEIPEGEVLILCFRALDTDGRMVSSRSYALTGKGP